MIGPSFINLFTQPGSTQPSANLVEQQPPVNLPPYITPITPTPKGGSPFGDMSDKLSGKNKQLGLMLFALGGALRGDKDFVKDTLALQQMQEGKEKQEAQKKKYQDFLAKLPDGSFKDLATALGPSKLDDLLLERYKAEQPKEKTVADYKAYLAKKYASGEPLSPQDLQLEAYLANLDPYERRIRNIPPAGQGGIDTGRINITDISEAEKYPKGTIVYLNGQAIIVD